MTDFKVYANVFLFFLKRFCSLLEDWNYLIISLLNLKGNWTIYIKVNGLPKARGHRF